MYKINSKYIFEEKEPLKTTIKFRTTRKTAKVLQDIAIDNEMSLSMLINNAIAQYFINNITQKKPTGQNRCWS